MKRLLAFGLSVFMLMVTPGFASSIFGPGSLGIKNRTVGVRSMAMGGAGLALSDSTYIPVQNPAGWYNTGRTRFQFGAQFYRSTAQDDFGEDITETFIIPSFAMSVPFYKNVGLGIVYESLTDHDYLSLAERTWTTDSPIDTVGTYHYTERFQGDGGLSRAGLVLAVKKSKFSIGLTGDIYFGKFDNLWLAEFEESGMDDSGWIIRYKTKGFGFRGGMMMEILPGLTLAGVATLPVSLSSDENRVVQNGKETDVEDLEFELPFTVQGGVSYTAGRFRTAADFSYSDWESTTRDYYEDEYKNTISAALGIERLPLRGALDPWYEKWIYRAGAWYDQHYLDVGDNQLVSLGFSIGAGRLLKSVRGTFDFALTYELRGSVSENDAQETVIGFQLGWTVTEKWFERRKR